MITDVPGKFLLFDKGNTPVIISVFCVSLQSVVAGRNHRDRKAQALLREAVQAETERELRELQEDLQHRDGTQALVCLQDEPTRPVAGVLISTEHAHHVHTEWTVGVKRYANLDGERRFTCT